MAQLYAVRVFGCAGSTSVVSEAIDWAVDNNMDVISMSLGANFGAADNSDSEAVSNASAAGILVVAASGNAGSAPYITSAPASSEGAISAAATDATAGYPGATLVLTPGGSITVQNSNAGIFTNGTSLQVVVLRNPDHSVSLGCNEAEYDSTRTGGTSIAGKLVVTLRGSCARVYRAGAGQKYGAAAVAMINNAAGYPVFEGDIPGGDPAANPFAPVTIRFFGARGAPATDGNLVASAASEVENSAGIIPNPGFELAASFSSSGPRYGDSALKPSTTAPGVSVVSTFMGTGTGGIAESGTSMATPHVAGVAALVKEANRSWSIDDLRAAVVQTSSPAMMKDYSPRREGGGAAQALPATSTQAVVRGADNAASFGFVDLLQDFHGNRTVTVHNNGNKAIVFGITTTKVAGTPAASLSTPSSVTVGARSDAS